MDRPSGHDKGQNAQGVMMERITTSLWGRIVAVFTGLMALAAPGLAVGQEGTGDLVAPLPLEPAAPSAPFENADALTHFVDGVVRTKMDEHKIVGAVVAIVTGDEVLLQKGYGLANADTGEKVDPDKHLFRVASITKLFTAMGIMQLVEEGKVDVNADIRTYLGDLGFDDRQGTITVANLLTHTNGFEDVDFGYYGDNPDLVGLPTAEQLETFAMRQVRKPGEVTAYSNYGFALLGEIIARVSGMSYADYIHKRVYAPLGMTNSSVSLRFPATVDDPAFRARFAENQAEPHEWRAGRYEILSFPEPVRAIAPEGGMSSTAADMVKFMQAFLRDGRNGYGQVATPATMEQTRSVLFSQYPGLSGTAHGFWVVPMEGYTAFEHGGSINNFRSKIVMIPELDIGIFVSTNTESGGRLAGSLHKLLLAHFVPADDVAVPAPPADFADRAGQYEGTYVTTRRNRDYLGKAAILEPQLSVYVTDDDHLLVVDGSYSQRFVETSPGEFLATDGSLRMRFEGEKGRAAQFVYFSTDPYSANERIRYWETPGSLTTPIALALIAIILFLGKPIIWAMMGRGGDAVAELSSGGWAVLAAALAWCGTFFFAFQLTSALAADPNLFYAEFPFYPVPLLHGFAIAGGILTIIAFVIGGRIIFATEGPFGLWGKGQYAVTLALFAMLALALIQWNILPWPLKG